MTEDPRLHTVRIMPKQPKAKPRPAPNAIRQGVGNSVGNVDKPGLKPGRLETPRHGGGKLKRGGTIGPGRPPSAIRAALRLAFDERITVLSAIADGQPVVKVKLGDDTTESWVSATPADRLKALDLMAKYGLGTQVEESVDGDGQPLRRQVLVVNGVAVEF